MRRQIIDYATSKYRIRQTVSRILPPGATVLVVSKGDEDLLSFESQTGWHFPQDGDGFYAGYHPANGVEAIAHLEALRGRGARYIVFPYTSFWWLDNYEELESYLEQEEHKRLVDDEVCLIYELGDARAPRRVSGRGTKPPVACRRNPRYLPAPAGHLRFVTDFPETFPLEPRQTDFDARHMKLHWVIPDVAPGMGGPMAIFRLIQLLEQFGHESTLWIRGSTQHGSPDKARDVIRKHFVPVEARVRILRDPGELLGDAAIATHWSTAYPLRAVTRVRERFYLVQDFEPSFTPVGSEYLLAEATYRFGFMCIASSRWLADKLRDEYGARADRFVYGYDPSIYCEKDAVRRRSKRVAFYSRTNTARRAVELGLLALEMVAPSRPSLVVDCFGGKIGRMKVPFQYADHGVLPDHELADLYRQATVGIVFSSTNYSLIPHEMMGCGLPVVELRSESTLREFPHNVITLADPSPAAIAKEIQRLLDNKLAREQQAANARSYISKLTWDATARRMETLLAETIEERSRFVSGPTISIPQRGPVRRTAATTCSFDGPVVFAAQPEYYRSAYFDLTASGEHYEFPFCSADPSVLEQLPRFASERGAKTCIVFRPEWLSRFPEAFAQLKARGVAVIGYSTEPVPQTWKNPHADQLQRLETLKRALHPDFDLIIHYDPSSIELLEEVGFSRLTAHPLPVSRSLFFPEDLPGDFDVCFLGKSTPHREEMLAPLKMEFRTIHVAHGLFDEEARRLMNRSKLVLNLHGEPYLNFENRVIQALYCRRPVFSEQLSGALLEPGVHYTLVQSPRDLHGAVSAYLSASEPASAPDVDLSRFAPAVLLEVLGIGSGRGKEETV